MGGAGGASGSTSSGATTGGTGGGAGIAGAALQATRTGGPAPLAVQFDSTATTTATPNVDTFRQLTYSFDFGDDRGQKWAVSGKPKNTQQGGPIAAHVFDLPGTYVVTVRATDENGIHSDASVTINVQDPNTFYAGAKTICVSTSANYAGCPTGASQQTTLPSSYAGKRVLLLRGDSFGGINPQSADSGFQIGAFGIGAKPTVTGVSTGMVGGVAAWANDFTVMDLNIGAGAVNIEATTSRFLLYRNDIKTPGGADSMVNIGTAAGYYQEHDSGPVPGAIYWPEEVFLIENDIQGEVNSAGKPNLVVMGHFHRSAIMGNVIDRAAEHSLRVWAAGKLVISHNLIGGNHYAPDPPGIRGAVKIHSAGTEAFATTIAAGRYPATSQVLLANNIIGSTTYPGSFLSGFGPQNADPGTVEGLEDCIAEGNLYVHGPYTSSDLQLRGRRMTARGNTVQGGGTPDIVRSGAAFDPALNAWDGPYFITN
jgi:PKD repeat protein